MKGRHCKPLHLRLSDDADDQRDDIDNNAVGGQSIPVSRKYRDSVRAVMSVPEE